MHVHDNVNESCVCLQNYTLVFTNMVAKQSSVLKMRARLKESIAQCGTFCSCKSEW